MNMRVTPPKLVQPVGFASPAESLRRAPLTDVLAHIDTLLQRVEAVEPSIHALLPDETPEERRTRIMRAAEQLARRYPIVDRRPPLFGALAGIKDLFRVDGFPTRAGSKLPASLFSGRQASAVSRLTAAGALVLGKTVTTEFAYFGPGETRNPWNTAHTPGGSSSGSAAAVAAGECHLALGTQTIGSISRPATFCGMVGFKPSFGRIPADGVIPFSRSADHVGVIAPSVRVAALSAAVLCDSWRVGEPETRTDAPGVLLVPDDTYLAQADENARAVFEDALDRLVAAGWKVERLIAFAEIERINEVHNEMIAAEFANVHATWFSMHNALYHPKSAELIAKGRKVGEDRVIQAKHGRVQLREQLEEAMRRFGKALWVAPATVGEAPQGIESTGSPIMNLPWTYAGLPTVSMPTGNGPNGLPLGIQIVAPLGEDEYLLTQAGVIEERVALRLR